jgi:hypothetical protein
MKYLFKYVPDEHSDGFIRKYIEGVSTINPTNHYRLEIDYDLCAPMETWTLSHSYEQFENGVKSEGVYKQQVYHGKELTSEQVDLMVELVMEHEYINFGEFISQ